MMANQRQDLATTRGPSRARWIAAAACAVYGFAKLNGSQFTILDSELTKPLGEVSGFWLTWYYFGYSAVYGTLIALLQIGGGVMLAWPRTALLGALVLFPVFVNIILIDLFYGIDLGATVVALLVLGSLSAVIAPHVARLRAAVLLDPIPRLHAPLQLIALATILVGSWAFTWWAANYNNRAPTPIDGVWAVASTSGPLAPEWRQVFFERNRAHWVVFRAADGRDELHHFEVDAEGVVRIWQTWLKKGALIMQGRMTPDGQLELELVGGNAGARMRLRREHRAREHAISRTDLPSRSPRAASVHPGGR